MVSHQVPLCSKLQEALYPKGHSVTLAAAAVVVTQGHPFSRINRLDKRKCQVRYISLLFVGAGTVEGTRFTLQHAQSVAILSSCVCFNVYISFS